MRKRVGRALLSLAACMQFVALVGAFVLASSGCVDSRRGPGVAVPPAPTIAERDEEGQHLAYFFAPGCPDCREVDETVIPELADRGFAVEKVNVEAPEGLETLRSVAKRLATRIDVLAPIVLYEGRLLRGSEEIRDFFLADTFLGGHHESELLGSKSSVLGEDRAEAQWIPHAEEGG